METGFSVGLLLERLEHAHKSSLSLYIEKLVTLTDC